MKIIYCSFLFFISTVVNASGPGKIAKIDRSLWPFKVNTQRNFDVASKCEMLVFVEIFKEYSSLSEIELCEKLELKNINYAHIKQWENKIQTILVDNFKDLSNESLEEIVKIEKQSDWDKIRIVNLKNKIPKNLEKWYNASKNFHEYYLYEQYRLAGLFPRITSEISKLSDAEVSGHEFKQKHFLLTFDDGPTRKNGNTDKLIEVLDQYKLKAIFFVLGDAFTSRLNASSSKSLIDLYGSNNLIASHGKYHKSHQKGFEWQASIDYTSQLIKETYKHKDKIVYFRPPYGQRNKALIEHLNKENSKVILWNIDSQDWNRNINAQEVADRQITLMLLWRKGILLFHDIHLKAQESVPLIYNYFKGTSIVWEDPNTMKF